MAISLSESYKLITWDIGSKLVNISYFGKKDDTGRGLRIKLVQNSAVVTPTTETLRIYCLKSDGTKVYIDAEIENGKYKITLTNQVYSVAGPVECELQLNVNGEWITSDTFIIKVSDNLVDSSILSSNEFNALQNALSDVDYVKNSFSSKADKTVFESEVSRINNDLTDRATKTEVEVERQRINLIQSNPGSTSGDLALNDIKVGFDGKTWDTPGNAVRGQVNELKEDLNKLNKLNTATSIILNSVNMYDESTSYIGATSITSDYIEVDGGKTVYMHRNNSSGIFGNYNIDKIEEYSEKNGTPIKTTYSVNSVVLEEATKFIKITQTKTYDDKICLSYRLQSTYSEYFNPVIVPNSEIISLSNFETTDYLAPILSILDAGKTVFVPKGIWITSPITLHDGDCIVGENVTYPFYEFKFASILAPKTTCDVFVNATNCTQINLNIVLANVDANGYNVDYAKTHLKLDNVHYSSFNLCIYGLIENGMTIKDSWECSFDKVYFRKVLKPGVVCLRYKKSTTTGGNISQNYFNDIQAEGLGCTILYSEDQSRVVHININSIMYEGTPFDPFTRTTDAATVSVPLIYLEHANMLHIGTIICNNLKYMNGQYEGVIYESNNFITIGNGIYMVKLSIDNFMMDNGTSSDFVIAKADESVNSKSYVIIKNLEYDHTHNHSVIQGGLTKLIINDLLA